MTSAPGHSPAPASDPQRPAVNLALQGGGSHGAFTWGVLDLLLEDGRVAIEGISGTSAGAMNAVALAQGFAQVHGKAKADPREAARAALASFWEGIVQMGALSEAQRAPFEILFGQIGGAASANTVPVPAGGLSLPVTKAIADTLQIYAASSTRCSLLVSIARA